MISDSVAADIKPGVTVRVYERIKDKSTERLSRFEGIVLARKHGREPGASFTVRATVGGVGVEKVYPLYSPLIKKVEIVAKPRRIRRAKLYYLRTRTKKEIRRRIRPAAQG
jgi:large subunit ribosomal protein L19